VPICFENITKMATAKARQKSGKQKDGQLVFSQNWTAAHIDDLVCSFWLDAEVITCIRNDLYHFVNVYLINNHSLNDLFGESDFMKLQGIPGGGEHLPRLLASI